VGRDKSSITDTDQASCGVPLQNTVTRSAGRAGRGTAAPAATAAAADEVGAALYSSVSYDRLCAMMMDGYSEVKSSVAIGQKYMPVRGSITVAP